MCRENVSVGVVEHPIFNNFKRVGRAVVSMVPGVPFPSDLLRNANRNERKITRFIDVLQSRTQTELLSILTI